jgi:hypothetical protein
MTKLTTIITALALSACAAQQGDPLEQYLLGVRDAVAEAQASHPSPLAPPDIYVDLTTRGDELGACRVIAGRRVVYLYVASILRRVHTTAEARLRIAEVLARELGNAALACSDADHGQLP